MKICNLFPLFAIALVAAACVEPNTNPTPSSEPQEFDAQRPEVHGIIAIADGIDSSAVSIINRYSGGVSEEEFLDSGTQSPTLIAFLSDDVVGPSQASMRNEIVLIDRANATLTFVDPRSKDIRVQYTVGDPSYGANPYDYSAVATEVAYVARWGALVDNEGDILQGSDILVINPDTGESITTIDMQPYVSAVPNTTATTFARPTSITLIEDYAYVLLQNITGDWDVGKSTVAVIDTNTHEVVHDFELGGYKNCSGLSFAEDVSGATTVCSGQYYTLDRDEQNALLMVDVSDPLNPEIKYDVDPTDILDSQFTSGSAHYLGDNNIVVTFEGANDWSTGDNLTSEKSYRVDLAAGADSATKINEVEDAFVTSYFADSEYKILYHANKEFGNESLTAYGINEDGSLTQLHTIDAGPSGILLSRFSAY